MKIGRRFACCSHSFKDAAQLPQWALTCLCSTSVSLLPSFPSPPPRHSLVKTRLPGPFHQVGAQSLCVCCGGGGGHQRRGPGGPTLPTTTVHPASFRCFACVYYEMFHPTRLPYSIRHSPPLEDSPVDDEASALPTDSWAASCQQALLRPTESSVWILGCATLHSEFLCSTLWGRQAA